MSALLIRLFIKDRDNVKDKNVRKKYGYLGSCTGIILNIMLFLGKLIAGFVSGAVSVMADAFNNLSDAGSSIMSLVGFKMAAKSFSGPKPPTKITLSVMAEWSISQVLSYPLL
mgnify:CR=1 FL=1